MASTGSLDIPTLENWLWEAACVIRGPIDAPEFKDYILPLIFLKRLSDVFDDELADQGRNAKYVDQDHKLVRFYLPQAARRGPSPRRQPASASPPPMPCGRWHARTPGSRVSSIRLTSTLPLQARES